MTRLLAGLIVVLAATPAWAQAPFGRPPTNPRGTQPISPYLNLFRGGNPAINYYGLVRPETDIRASLLQFQQQQGLLEQAVVGRPDVAGLLITGHPSQFMNFSHYYAGRVTNPGTLSPALSAPAIVPPAGVPPAIAGGAFLRR